MALKELKSLRDQIFNARERLEQAANRNKDTRVHMRKGRAALNQINQETIGLDAKFVDKGEETARNSILTASELQSYSSAIQRVTLGVLFDTIAEKTERFQDISLGVTFVDILFENVKISFRIGHSTTFRDLRCMAANYWSIASEDIFFSDQPPSVGAQALFLLDGFVLEEVYVWKKIKIKDSNFLLYLVLREYMSLEERMELIYPRNSEKSSINDETQDFTNIFISNQKRKEIKVLNKSKIMKTRRIRYKIMLIVQWILYFALFFLWTFLMATELNVTEATWVNKELASVFLWDFSFDDRGIGSANGTSHSSPLMSVTNRDSLWDYISGLENKMKTASNYGIVSSSIYSLQYIQLRQVRSHSRSCSNKYLTYNCSKSYSWRTYSTENFGNYSYQKYKEMDSNVFIYGALAIYPMSGFITDINTMNVTGWSDSIKILKESQWIDDATRAVFISMNYYNPSSKIVTTLIPFFEITESNIIVPNFKIYSVRNMLFTSMLTVFHLLILFISAALFVLELKDIIRIPEEVAFMNGTCTIGEENLYMKVVKSNKLNIFKRLRKPNLQQIVSLCTLGCAIILEFASYGWYLSRFKESVVVNEGYMDLYGTLQGFSMMNDARTIVTFLLGINISKYFISTFKSISSKFQAMAHAATQYCYFFFLFFIPMITLAFHLYYYLGPYDNTFNSFEKSMIAVIRIFIGQWPSDFSFLSTLDSGYLFILLLCIMIWKMIVLSFQILIFQSFFASIRNSN